MSFTKLGCALLVASFGCTTGAAESTAPGASYLCDSSGKDAFDTYGATAFVAVNKAIFSNVGNEVMANGASNVGDSFTKVGTGAPSATGDSASIFEGKLAAFLVYAYGGPTEITYTDGATYSGMQDMVAAHTGLGITSAQYDYFITSLVVPALVASGVKHGAGGAADPDDVSSCFAPVVTDPAFKATIVGQ